MIPEKYTPIKNEILTEIFAKGLLSKNEMRIALYIIRWSWGFGKKGEKKRQDWTQKLSKTKIANDIKMNKGMLIDNLNRMIREKKVKEKNKCYQFNENFKEWRSEKILRNSIKIIRKTNKVIRKTNKIYYDSQYSLVEKPNRDNSLPDPKEKKKNINKNKDKVFPLNYLFNFNKDEDNGAGPTDEQLAGGWYVRFPDDYDYEKENRYFEYIEKSEDKVKAIKALIDKIDDEECERLIKMAYKEWEEFQKQYPNGDRKRSELHSQIVDIIMARDMAEVGM